MRLLILLVAGVSLLANFNFASAATPPVRVALVIGNSGYADVPALPNPASDAAAVGEALRAVGFSQVTVVTDLDHQALYTALRAFAAQSEKADWSVLYYAGHGIEVDGKNYLVPIDAHLATDRDVDFEAVPMQTVLSAVSGAHKLRLVILDACRDNPFLQRMARSSATRSIQRGLARVTPEGDLYLVYSAKSGQVAVDGGTGRSPFVAALLKNIAVPGLEINLLFRRIHADVKEASDGRQEPDFEGILPAEELYFRPRTAMDTVSPPADQAIASDVPAAPLILPAPARLAAREAPAPSTPAAPAAYAYVTGLDPNGDNFLALRPAPDLRGARIMKMGSGTLLTVLARQGPWAQVRLRSGETGWAFARYVACCRSQ